MARKWSNLNLPGALHYVTGNFQDRIPVFTQEAACKCFTDTLRTLLNEWPCVKSAKDYRWSSFRAFYTGSEEPLKVDKEWWWEEDSEKLSKAMKELGWRTYHKRD
jgi:hypothetical protein